MLSHVSLSLTTLISFSTLTNGTHKSMVTTLLLTNPISSLVLFGMSFSSYGLFRFSTSMPSCFPSHGSTPLAWSLVSLSPLPWYCFSLLNRLWMTLFQIIVNRISHFYVLCLDQEKLKFLILMHSTIVTSNHYFSINRFVYRNVLVVVRFILVLWSVCALLNIFHLEISKVLNWGMQCNWLQDFRFY